MTVNVAICFSQVDTGRSRSAFSRPKSSTTGVAIAHGIHINKNPVPARSQGRCNPWSRKIMTFSIPLKRPSPSQTPMIHIHRESRGLIPVENMPKTLLKAEIATFQNAANRPSFAVNGLVCSRTLQENPCVTIETIFVRPVLFWIRDPGVLPLREPSPLSICCRVSCFQPPQSKTRL